MYTNTCAADAIQPMKYFPCIATAADLYVQCTRLRQFLLDAKQRKNREFDDGEQTLSIATDSNSSDENFEQVQFSSVQFPKRQLAQRYLHSSIYIHARAYKRYLYFVSENKTLIYLDHDTDRKCSCVYTGWRKKTGPLCFAPPCRTSNASVRTSSICTQQDDVKRTNEESNYPQTGTRTRLRRIYSQKRRCTINNKSIIILRGV